MKGDYICRLFCFDFAIEHNHVIEFRIVDNRANFSLQKGVHVETWVMPEFHTVSQHSNLKAAFVDAFAALREIEIAFGLYPKLETSIPLSQAYMDVIDKLVYSLFTLHYTPYNNRLLMVVAEQYRDPE